MSLKFRAKQALADLRTAASALHYLLEPERNQTFPLTVVSNSSAQKLVYTGTTPLTLASNSSVQALARSNATASPWILGSNVARPRILGPVLSDPQADPRIEPQADPQPAPARPCCYIRTCLAG